MASLEYTAQSPYNVTTAPVQPAMPQVANNDFLQTIPFGLRSNTWRTQDAEMAKSLAKNGVDAISIYKQTGTWLSSDGKWRQEVAKGGQFQEGAGKAGLYKLPADYNVKGPVDRIAEAAKAQYAKGALSGLLNNPKQSIGDAVKDVKNLFNPEYMRNIQGMSNEEVTNLALDANPVMAATFIGKGAKTWDAANASKAMKMADKGIDERTIWEKTGTFKGADGQWRQEISDHNAQGRFYQKTPSQTYNDVRTDAFIKDSQALRDKANSMLPYADRSKNSLLEEYASKGGAIVDAKLAGNDELVRKLLDDRAGLDAMLNDMGNSKYGPASTFLKHGDLGKAYPDVYKMHTRISPDDIDGFRGQYLEKTPTRSEQMILARQPIFNDSKSTMLHEMQHAIQGREGFARGGSVNELQQNLLNERNQLNNQITELNNKMSELARVDKMSPQAQSAYDMLMEQRMQLVPRVQQLQDNDYIAQEAFRQYKNLSGEAESRATQARMSLTPQERRALFPFDSYDVPRESLIVRGLLERN